MPKHLSTNKPRAPALILQPRDRAILRFIFHHRFLTSTHIHQLAFHARTKRAAQHRLYALHAKGYIAQRTVHTGFSGRSMIYSLTRKGAAVVATDTGLPLSAIPRTKAQNLKGFATMAHHLVATDFLVALGVAALHHPLLELMSVDREHHLRHRLGRYNRLNQLPRPHLVSDGAVTLKRGTTSRTCHLEVVRSPVAGGSSRYIEKLKRWLKAFKDGYTKRVWGHAPVGALLTLTTNPGRTRNLREAAATLKDRRGRLWFGTYDPTREPLTPSTILTHVWHDTVGEAHTLLGKLPGS